MSNALAAEAQTAINITLDIPPVQELLTDEALNFLAALHRQFNATRLDLLAARKQRQAAFDAGGVPDFLPETQEIRESDWQVAPIPAALQDRRVEITGPVDRKMVINALNSGAKMYMADFEDSHGPTWQATLEGHCNIRDALIGDIEFTSEQGKHYALGDNPATLIVRPRGWHLPEKHVLIDGEPMSGALFDFGLNVFLVAKKLAEQGKQPFYYLPKMEHHLEARLWNDVFDFAEKELSIAHGSIKATALIETLPAVFQMHEILFEMKDYLVGLNCGRWDYIFSYIKTFRLHADKVLPERGQVGMTVPFLDAYSRLLIQTCHRRGAFAMGGMAAHIPIKGDEAANQAVLEKVHADKLREVTNGHDGTWVAHPGLVQTAMAVFDEHMPTANQVDRKLDDVAITAEQLRQPSEGSITPLGLKQNIEVSIEYLAAWIGGNGCVPIHNLMEDAATAEISRSQIWQWIRYGSQLDNGTVITLPMVREMITNTVEIFASKTEDEQARRYYQQAADLFESMVASDELDDFITLKAYQLYD